MSNKRIAFSNKIKNLQPVTQAYFVIALCLLLQYALNTMAYFEFLPDIAGKSLNSATKNLTYLIPGVLAVAFLAFFEGRAGLARVVRPYLTIPLNPLWWIIAGAGLIPLLFISLYLDDLIYLEPFQWYALSLPSWEEFCRYAPGFVRVAISDELFWIGFVYPRLLHAGHSSLKASLVIGLLWGLDYLPFLFTEFFLSPGMNASNLIFGWLAIAPFYIWLYHKTKSACLIVFFNVCMQSIFNALPVLPAASGDNSEMAMANLICFSMSLLIWYLWPNGKPYELGFLNRAQAS